MVDMLRVRAVSEGWSGGPGLNTFYFSVLDPLFPNAEADAVNAVARVQAAFNGSKAAFPPQWSVQVSPEVDRIGAGDGELVESFGVAAPAPIVGTGVPGFGPQVTMICLSYQTAGVVNGRRVKGRAYLGPMAQASDIFGTPEAGIVTTFRQFGDALLSSGVQNPLLQVWSRPKYEVDAQGRRVPNAAITQQGSAHKVTSTSVRDSWAVMRSRRA